MHPIKSSVIPTNDNGKPVNWADFQFEILRFESFGIKISHFFIIQNHQTSPMIITWVD